MADQLLSAEGRVTLITTFTVPEGNGDRFLEQWRVVGVAMAGLPGYLGARLFKPLVGDVSNTYVHVAEWKSAQHLASARADPSVRAAEDLMDSGESAGLIRRRVLYRQLAENLPRST